MTADPTLLQLVAAMPEGWYAMTQEFLKNLEALCVRRDQRFLLHAGNFRIELTRVGPEVR